MQKHLRELQPTVFEDPIAMNALYRPGPMDYIPDFIDRKQGRKPIEYDIPCMEKYLKDTYGITVYQEQVMLLSRQLADFTRGESDALRKAMGKKKKDIVDAMKPKFIEGGAKNGHDPKILDKIWTDWEKFASYAFNKSHATCYSWVAYQTAFLKANFPAQFMAAVMSRSLDNITEIRKLMDECKQMGINTLGPDVNESRHKFAVNTEGDIRFGMAAIKGVGESAVQAIIDERSQNGPFTSVFNFFERVNLSQCNKKNIENLIVAGAFDCFSDIKRETYFVPSSKAGETYLDALVRYGNNYQQDKFQAQTSLFGGMDVAVSHPPLPKNIYEWGKLERLNKERELVGIYLSAHPLDDYAVILNHVCNTRLNQLEEQKEELSALEEVTIGGIVTSVRIGESKTGNPFGIVKMEDFAGNGELALFGRDWITYRNFFVEGASLYIKLKFEAHKFRPGTFNMIINSIELLSDVKDKLIQKITFNVALDKLTSTMVEDLAEIVKENPGNTELIFNIHSSGNNSLSLMSRKVKVRVEERLMRYIQDNDSIDIKIN
jgi:DNA polymerase-3 subunit alpha